MRTSIAFLMASFIGTAAHAEELVLFNGKDLTGWIGVLGVRPGDTRTVEDVWKVQDGTIVCTGGKDTWASLHTLKSYTNFRLQLEFRWLDPAATGGNAGVFLRSNPPPEAAMLLPALVRMPSPMAYQAQIIGSGSTGDIWIMGYDHPTFRGERLPPPRQARPANQAAAGGQTSPSGQAASGNQVAGGGGRNWGPLPPGMAGARNFPRSKFAEKPIGEWNAYDITFKGDTLILKLNGEEVNRGTGAPVVAGRIGLECEPTPIAFRNIRLTTLD